MDMEGLAASIIEARLHMYLARSKGPDCQYPIQKITEIYNKITEMYKKVTKLEISSWNVLFLLRSEVAYIGTGHIGHSHILP
jgi:hypothetical protein